MPDLSRTLRNAFTRVLNRRSAVRHGRLETIENFSSAVLGNQRRITIYLPPGYDEHPEQTYPVLYVNDGQNLFDPSRAFGGTPWNAHIAADEAIGARTMRPVILAGIDHMEVDRVHEYTPVRDVEKAAGGRGDDYGTFLLEELRPAIERRYRVFPGSSAVGGSSLGGLISMHLALTRPHEVAAAAVMSPSVWWAGRELLREVEAFHGNRRPRLWLDVGGREGREAVADVRALRELLLAKGWNDSNLRYFEDRRAEHSEHAWGARFRKVLEFLFPPD